MCYCFCFSGDLLFVACALDFGIIPRLAKIHIRGLGAVARRAITTQECLPSDGFLLFPGGVGTSDPDLRSTGERVHESCFTRFPLDDLPYKLGQLNFLNRYVSTALNVDYSHVFLEPLVGGLDWWLGDLNSWLPLSGGIYEAENQWVFLKIGNPSKPWFPFGQSQNWVSVGPLCKTFLIFCGFNTGSP